MSASAAVEQQRKIPSRERRQPKKREGKTVSKAAASSAANTLKRPSSGQVSTPPPRGQQHGTKQRGGQQRGGQDASHLLNFRAPERQRDSGSRPLPHRRRGPVVEFDKDRFFGANYRFVVARDANEDYGVHLAFADKTVDWPLIREVHVTEEGSYNCPICLEPPIAARLTQCGHVYCWPCIKRLLHVAAKPYAPCPICTNIVTASRDMLKPAVVHANDPIKVNNDVSLELMRRERGSTVAVRASSVADNDVGQLNVEIGLPKEGPGGAVCPIDVGHCDAKFMKVLSIKDPKLISERVRNDLMDALKLCHSSGDLEMVPHIESCLRDLEMHDAEYAAELALKSGEVSDASVVAGTVPAPGCAVQKADVPVSAPMSPAAKALPASAVTFSPAAAPFSPSAAPFSPSSYSPAGAKGGRGGVWGGSDSPSSALNRSGSYNQKIWLDGELLDASALDEPEDSDDEYMDQLPDDDYDEEHQDELDDPELSVADSVDGEGGEAGRGLDEEEGEQAAAEMHEANARAHEFAVDGIHFFYQASDGQKVFLHPVSMRCLLEEHGSYLSLPRMLKAKVLDMEICVQTEELRKRHRALEHVPISADIRFVEVDVAPLLSKGTLEKMRKKLDERAKLRRQRTKREAQQAARAEQRERRQREINNPPPPPDLMHGPSLMVSMAAAQAKFDEDTLQALLLSESLSPPLPSELATAVGASPDTPSEESASSAGASGPRWTQMVQEGRVSARELQMNNEQFFPTLGAETFPSLGASSPSGRSPPAARSPSGGGWSKATAPAAASAGWGGRVSTPSKGGSVAGAVGKSGGKQGWNAASDGRRGPADDADLFEMDDLEEEISAEERQRRREQAADMAWETALAASASTAAAPADAAAGAATPSSKGKKGRKGQVLLAWG